VDTTALILFVDARGFTRWADSPEVFARLNQFASAFYATLGRAFPKEDGFFFKGLGDGAMMVLPIRSEMTAKAEAALITDVLRRIRRADGDFEHVCAEFARSIGHTAELSLGWGVARGAVQQIRPPDYVGPNVNKCARLCALARPFGVVVDYNDFPSLPRVKGFKFFEQHRLLAGIVEPVRVWVTEAIASQFLTRESLRQQPEVHITGHCIDPEVKARPRILIARRSETRRIHPGMWEGCGGQLAANETFVEGVRRHFLMEMKLRVKVLENLHCFYEVRERGEPLIPGIRFLCELEGAKEDVQSHNHSEWKWVTEAEFKNVPEDQIIPGLRDEVLTLLARYKAGER
jgi:class 3 adenylate cyclase